MGISGSKASGTGFGGGRQSKLVSQISESNTESDESESIVNSARWEKENSDEESAEEQLIILKE